MWFGKRLFDLFFAIFGLVVMVPFFVIIALLIKLKDSGSVFFLQTRVGLNGKPFKILKFRTMTPPKNNQTLLITVGNDPRITPVGGFLRSTKLDELPQLINILKGDMSFVGPRPEVEKYVAHFPETDRQKIFSMKPGITDLASIEFSNESELLKDQADPEKFYIESILPAKIKLALKYYETASLTTDVVIILKTLKKII